MQKLNKTICSFYLKCKNYKKECHRCTLNANNKFSNYLLIQDDDGKTLHFVDAKWI